MRTWCAIWLATAATGCGLRAGWVPDRYRATPEKVAESPFGAWVAVYDATPGSGLLVVGELIATTPITVVLLEDDGTVAELAWAGIRQVRVYRGDTRDIVGGATMSSMMSLGLLAPAAWTAAWRSGVGRRRPVRELDALNRYARFPQGLPEGLALDTLLPRPRSTGGAP